MDGHNPEAPLALVTKPVQVHGRDVHIGQLQDVDESRQLPQPRRGWPHRNTRDTLSPAQAEK